MPRTLLGEALLKLRGNSTYKILPASFSGMNPESFWKVTDGLSKENCIAAHLFAKQVRQLYRQSGPLSTALYLKQCGVCLQQVYAGPPYEHERLPVFVSLSRNGLPRIIPSFHRKVIMRKDDKADTLVQLYLSFFYSLCHGSYRWQSD